MRYFDDIETGVTVATAGEYEFKQDEIIRFARDWDPQPFQVDPETAMRTPAGGITASACHVVGTLLISKTLADAVVQKIPHIEAIPCWFPGR